MADGDCSHSHWFIIAPYFISHRTWGCVDIFFPGGISSHEVLLDGGFKYLYFIFAPEIGEDEPILTSFFSKALVQAPTRLLIIDHLSIQYIDMFRYKMTIQYLKKTTVFHFDTVTDVDITWQPKWNNEVWASHRCNAILRWSALQRGSLGWCWLRSTYREASRECWRGENLWWKGGRCKPWAYRGCSFSRIETMFSKVSFM